LEILCEEFIFFYINTGNGRLFTFFETVWPKGVYIDSAT